jgi:translation initiation factor IF-3
MDLVEISPEATPPVAKVMNWSKVLFTEEKERRAARSRQRTTNVTKEVQLRPEIDAHDLLVKAQAASRFLAKGLRVRVVVNLHGRFIERPEIATSLLERFSAAAAEPLGHLSSDIQDGPVSKAGRHVSQALHPVRTAHSPT